MPRQQCGSAVCHHMATPRRIANWPRALVAARDAGDGLSISANTSRLSRKASCPPRPAIGLLSAVPSLSWAAASPSVAASTLSSPAIRLSSAACVRRPCVALAKFFTRACSWSSRSWKPATAGLIKGTRIRERTGGAIHPAQLANIPTGPRAVATRQGMEGGAEADTGEGPSPIFPHASATPQECFYAKGGASIKRHRTDGPSVVILGRVALARTFEIGLPKPQNTDPMGRAPRRAALGRTRLRTSRDFSFQSLGTRKGCPRHRQPPVKGMARHEGGEPGGGGSSGGVVFGSRTWEGREHTGKGAPDCPKRVSASLGSPGRGVTPATEHFNSNF